MGKVLEPEGETMKPGSLYKFAMLTSLEISDLGKNPISPNWWNQFYSNLWFSKEVRWIQLSTKFHTQSSINFVDTVETISGISTKEIEEN